MGQIIEEIITDFTPGITDEPRDSVPGAAQCVSNFDIFTRKRAMIPYADSEDGGAYSGEAKRQNFDLGFFTPSGGSWKLFGLGVVSGTTRAEINYKNLTTTGDDDLADATWVAPAGNASASGATSFNLFKYYKATGKIYGAKAGTTIWAFTPDGSTAFDDASHSLSYTNIAQGLVHSKDDILYVPYDNKIARNNAGSWTDVAITLPSIYYITSICEYGNYIAIACAPLSGSGKSRVYLWDRDSSLATLAESIDWGEGSLMVLEEEEGYLVGVSIDGSSTSRLKNRIIFRSYSGGSSARKFKEFIGYSIGDVAGLSIAKQKFDNRVYFTMYLKIDGEVRRGVWSIGLNSSGSLTVAHERTPNNDTDPGLDPCLGFFIVGDFMFIAYYDASSNIALSKTVASGTFHALQTASWSSGIKNAGDSDLIKDVIGMSAMFEPLLTTPTTIKVRLLYKKDEETTWRLLSEVTTDNAISKGSINIANRSDDTFTVTSATPAVFTQLKHGLAIGQKIRLTTTGALYTGLAVDTDYYVISAGYTSSTFELSATSGGTAINTSGSQSGTHSINRLSEKLREGKEFKFRIESIGAVITGFKYKMEILDGKQLY